MTTADVCQRTMRRRTTTLLVAGLALGMLAGCLGFGMAGSLPAGSIQIKSDANATHEVTITVAKIANDSDVLHQRNDTDLAALVANGSRVWNEMVTLGPDSTWTEREAIDEPGAYQVSAVSRRAVALEEGEAANRPIGEEVGNDTAWLGLYRAGRDGEQVAEETVWIHLDEGGRLTISTPSDD